MTTLLHPPVSPQAVRTVRDPRPERPPIREDDRREIESRGLPATATDWLEVQVDYHQCQSQESATDPIGTHDLIAERLETLARTLRGQSARGVAAHDAQEAPLPMWWGVEIERRLAGQGPIRRYESLLARCVLDEAALLAPYDSPVKRLVVRRLLNLASDCESFGSDNAWSFAADYEDARTMVIASLATSNW